MRQAAILNDDYENILIREAEKTGLVEPKYDLSSILDDPAEFARAHDFYNSLIDKRVEDRKDLFRSILLFDEIILPHAPGEYNYDLLERQGCFKIVPFDDFYNDTANSFRGEVGSANYVLHAKALKPAVLPVLGDRLRSYFKLLPDGFDYEKLVSTLYDCYFEKKPIPSKYNKIISTNKEFSDLLQSEHFEKLRHMNCPDLLLEKGNYYTGIAGIIATCYEDLSWQLHISSNNDATIINCCYNLADIGCTDFSEKANLAGEAYKVLRVECAKMIGTFPEINSIQEVIQIKEKRHNDLKNLRQELSHLEYEIKNGSSKGAVEMAARDVGKASRAFSKGNTIYNVSKWLSIFTIGIGAASFYIHNPILEIGSFTLETSCSAGKAYGERVKESGNWTGIVF